MIRYLKQLTGELKIDQYKSISCKVDLEIDQLEHDEWADSDPNYDPDNYINDIRVIGELNFDTSPIAWNDKHPVKINAIGKLVVTRDDFPLMENQEVIIQSMIDKKIFTSSSHFNILITEKINEVDIVPKKIRRYFWRFFIVGKPIIDLIQIFPNNYTGVKMNKVFYCTNFRGYWPVGVSSVIVAKDKEDARSILTQQLIESSILIEDSNDFELKEINLNERKAVVLNDGAWQ